MSDLAWAQEHTNVLEFVMVSPNNLDETLGVIDNVDLDNSSITWGYYTDTRVSAKLTLVDSNYIKGSFVRIIYKIPEFGYSVELGTFLPSDDPTTFQNGSWVTNLTLQSTMYAMDMDIDYRPILVKQGTSAMALWKQIVKSAKRQYIMMSPKDATYSSDYLLTDSQLSRIDTLASDTDNRNDVDGHGRITIDQYIAPASKEPEYVLDLDDEDGIIQDGIQVSSDFLKIPNRVVVEYTYSETESKEVTQHYTVSDTTVKYSQGTYTPGNSRVDVMINWALAVANNNSIGYQWGGRGPEYDCSGLVGSAAMHAGLVGSAPSTYSMISVYTAAGWTYHSGLAGIKRGCAVLRTGHTELYIGNGQNVGAMGNKDGRPGDSSGREISVHPGPGNFSGYLEPPASAYVGSGGGYTPGKATTTTTTHDRSYQTTEYSSKQISIYGSADAVDGSMGRTARGYVITDYHTVNDMSPKTEARANELAKKYLDNDQHESREWTVNLGLYLPVTEGNIIRLDVHDGPYKGEHKMLVKSTELNLKDMSMGLTLKELGL